MSPPSGRELPPYARVVADIRARIAAGELAPGQRVPSTREITREWGVAMATATKALAALHQEGLVEAVRGVGTLVSGASAIGPAGVPEVDGPEKQGRDGDREHPPQEGPGREHAGRERPPRGHGGGHRPTPEAALTRDSVVRTSIAIADAEGLDGLSMRRVSSELRVSTMALYRHVSGKDDLVTAMIDTIYRESGLPEPPPPDWRHALEMAMLWEWGVYRRHPWAIRLTPMTGPVGALGLMANAEWMMGVVTAQGRSADTALQVITVLSAFTSGMAVQATQAVVDEDELGITAEDWWRSRAPEFLEIAAQGKYPVMFSVSGPPDIDEAFTVGMERLLDGMTPLIVPEGS